MKNRFLILSIFSMVLPFMINFFFDKVWVKGFKRAVPKNGGVNNSWGEYIIYTLITSLVSAIITRQIGLIIEEQETSYSVDNIDYEID